MFEISFPFGVELEFSSRLIDRDSLNSTCREVFSEFNCRYDSSERPDRWTLKGDSSCGHELTTPRLQTEADLELLRNVAIAIQSRHQGQNLVDSSCGLHVHLDLGDLTRNDLFRVARTMAKVEPFLYSLVPTSRRSGNYCRSIRDYQNCSGDVHHIPLDHFQGANFGRWMERGTLEVRYGSGSCNGPKVCNWVRLLQSIVSKAARNEIPSSLINTEADFWSWMGEPENEIDEEIKEWITERARFFRENDPQSNRRNYITARQIRDGIRDVAIRQYHYYLRRNMSREERRVHDQEVLARNEAGTLLEWNVPQDWLDTYYHEHPEHRPEDPHARDNELGRLEVDDEEDLMEEEE